MNRIFVCAIGGVALGGLINDTCSFVGFFVGIAIGIIIEWKEHDS